MLEQAARLAIAGSAIGVVAALARARVMRSLIYDVSPADLLTFSVVAILVIATALLACVAPALRAMKSSPMAALRAKERSVNDRALKVRSQ